jgi:lipoprotein-releasing system ATP-binding protein
MSNPTAPTPASDPSSAPQSRRGGAHVVVSGLKKDFVHGGVLIPVLRGLTFELRPGEIASVVGASGVGKSTLLQVLGTLDSPTAGEMTFDGTSLTKMTQARLAEFRNREIGFVFQFHHLLPEFTALENAMMPGLIMRLPRAECVERARTMLERMGLGHRLTHRPGELSGGEQQRVALARALANDPPIVLADEPTGNLDTTNGRHIMEILQRIHKTRHTTLVLVTHDAELAAVADARISLRDGRVV